MAYTSQTRLERILGTTLLIQLTDDAGSGAVGADALSQAMTAADDEVDGYLQAHYSVPLATASGIVSAIADDIAIYNLFRRRRATFGMPEDVVHHYDRRIKQLEKINSGLLDLGIEPPPASSSKVLAQSDGPDAVMTGGADGSLRDF